MSATMAMVILMGCRGSEYRWVPEIASERPYHEAMSAEIACVEIKRCEGTQFDPEVAKLHS